MAKKYPRIGSVLKRPKNTTERCFCGKVAKFKTVVQTWYMRGDDEYVWTCEDHKRDLEAITKHWKETVNG